jgi:ferredoxin
VVWEVPLRVEVDQEVCIGAGQCVLAAPAVFDQREDDGIVTLLTSEPPESEHALVEEAANRCPAAAIHTA